MRLDAEEKSPGKLRQALRTLFAFANAPEPEEDDPRPPQPPPTPAPEEDDNGETPPDDEEAPAHARIPHAALALHSQQQALPTEKGPYTMLTKQELIGRLIAHEHTAWTPEQTPMLQVLEERMLEQMLAEATRRSEEAPLTLKALQTELNTRDRALKDEYDQKLATHVQALEEKRERADLQGYFEGRGWTAEETAQLPLTALRRMHQELDPVSYLGNGLPRAPGQAWEESLPDDNPQYE